MILSNDNYVVYSRNSNTHYWEQGIFPTWTAINTLIWIPGQQRGAGVEPHYHDCDEFWLFTAGRGEVWSTASPSRSRPIPRSTPRWERCTVSRCLLISPMSRW